MENPQHERRRYVRYELEKTDITFELKLTDLIIINNGKIRDISYRGIGITSNQLPREGSILTLDFKLPPEQKSIISLGKVVWTGEINKRFGVELVTPSEKFMEELLEYLI